MGERVLGRRSRVEGRAVQSRNICSARFSSLLHQEVGRGPGSASRQSGIVKQSGGFIFAEPGEGRCLLDLFAGPTALARGRPRPKRRTRSATWGPARCVVEAITIARSPSARRRHGYRAHRRMAGALEILGREDQDRPDDLRRGDADVDGPTTVRAAQAPPDCHRLFIGLCRAAPQVDRHPERLLPHKPSRSAARRNRPRRAQRNTFCSGAIARSDAGDKIDPDRRTSADRDDARFPRGARP